MGRPYTTTQRASSRMPALYACANSAPDFTRMAAPKRSRDAGTPALPGSGVAVMAVGLQDRRALHHARTLAAHAIDHWQA
ncbi:MAG: hypothetical protein ACK55I_18415, partial [bacterium]